MTKFQNLIALARCDQDLPPTPAGSRMADIYRAAVEKIRKEKEEAAASELVEVLKAVESYKAMARSNIKHHKEQLKAMKRGLDAVDRAMAYADETNNFLPLLIMLGAARHDNNPLCEVPADWQPKVPPQPQQTDDAVD